MKLLKCSIHDQGYWEVTSNLEPLYKGCRYPIEQLHVNEIWASVPKAVRHMGQDFYEPVKKDIAKNGMKWPIMVVKSTREQLCYQKAKWQNKISPLPFWMAGVDDMQIIQPTVWGGSNRLYIARELGYTHIDCAIIPTFDIAHLLQKTMRESHPQYYPKAMPKTKPAKPPMRSTVTE